MALRTDSNAALARRVSELLEARAEEAELPELHARANAYARSCGDVAVLSSVYAALIRGEPGALRGITPAEAGPDFAAELTVEGNPEARRWDLEGVLPKGVAALAIVEAAVARRVARRFGLWQRWQDPEVPAHET